MSFGLGFWAAAGAGGAASAGAYEQIATTILGTSTSSITFSSIASTYKHLQIRGTARGTQNPGSGGLGLGIRLNGVTSSVYSSHLLWGDVIDTFSVISEAYTSQSSSYHKYALASAGASANVFSGFITDILDYTNTSKNQTLRTLYGNSGYSLVGLGSGNNFSTTAVSSVTFFSPDGGSLATGTRISLYGIKG
jgi:hypothetical protein